MAGDRPWRASQQSRRELDAMAGCWSLGGFPRFLRRVDAATDFPPAAGAHHRTDVAARVVAREGVGGREHAALRQHLLHQPRVHGRSVPRFAVARAASSTAAPPPGAPRVYWCDAPCTAAACRTSTPGTARKWVR